MLICDFRTHECRCSQHKQLVLRVVVPNDVKCFHSAGLQLYQEVLVILHNLDGLMLLEVKPVELDSKDLICLSGQVYSVLSLPENVRVALHVILNRLVI